VSCTGAVLFAVAPGLSALFVARALMGLGSGGLWIGVTFATLAYWSGQEYLCMSRIYAAYSVGALVGPLLGVLGGTSTPFLAYAALLVVTTSAAAAALRDPVAGESGTDRTALRTRRFWVAAVADGGADQSHRHGDGRVVPARDPRLPRRARGGRCARPASRVRRAGAPARGDRDRARRSGRTPVYGRGASWSVQRRRNHRLTYTNPTNTGTSISGPTTPARA